MKLSEWKGPWPVMAHVEGVPGDLQLVYPTHKGYTGISISRGEDWIWEVTGEERIVDWFEEPVATCYESSSMFKIKYEYFPAAPPDLVETISSDHKKCTCETLLNGHHNDCPFPGSKD